jgi:hypothetical protein
MEGSSVGAVSAGVAFKPLYVEQILVSSRSALVENEVPARQHADDLIGKLRLKPLWQASSKVINAMRVEFG